MDYTVTVPPYRPLLSLSLSLSLATAPLAKEMSSETKTQTFKGCHYVYYNYPQCSQCGVNSALLEAQRASHLSYLLLQL